MSGFLKQFTDKAKQLIEDAPEMIELAKENISIIAEELMHELDQQAAEKTPAQPAAKEVTPVIDEATLIAEIAATRTTRLTKAKPKTKTTAATKAKKPAAKPRVPKNSPK